MIYLDQAATSWPKPQEVVDAMARFMTNSGANPGRGGYSMSLDASRSVLGVREKTAAFFGLDDPSHVVFTANCTESLNMVMWGALWEGDHVILSSMEHNAVARTAQTLRQRGLDVTIVSCDPEFGVEYDDVVEAIRPNSKMIVWTHASNVFGTVFDIERLGLIAREFGLSFMVDAAQTAGLLPINMQAYNIDYLACAGHKSLYGPQGIGLLLIRRNIPMLEPWRSGGTGSYSEELDMPEVLPDRLEAGTLNTPGIIGLGAALDYIQERGIEDIYEHDIALIRYAYQELSQLNNVTLYGPSAEKIRVPLLSFNIGYQDSNWVAHQLNRRWDIAVRSGLHCAPLAHRSADTLDNGVVRVSVGIFNTHEEMQTLVQAVQELSKES